MCCCYETVLKKMIFLLTKPSSRLISFGYNWSVWPHLTEFFLSHLNSSHLMSSHVIWTHLVWIHLIWIHLVSWLFDWFIRLGGTSGGKSCFCSRAGRLFDFLSKKDRSDGFFLNVCNWTRSKSKQIKNIMNTHHWSIDGWWVKCRSIS